MTKAKSIIGKVCRYSAAGLALVVAAGVYVPTASAHGEKSQQAFLRMRTVHWYDLVWSKDKINVNDTMTLSGKMHIFQGWPETVDPPTTAFLNVGEPGPALTRVESYIGGKFVPRAVALELGKDYAFKLVLKGRRPGRWHVHCMINVEGGGPIIGPGKWVEVTGNLSDYKHEVTTLTGNTIDIETYGEGSIWFWSFLWMGIGYAWLWWWMRRPTWLPRFARVKAGEADQMITKQDQLAGWAFFIGTLVLTAVSYSAANGEHPITIPLQAGVIHPMTSLPPQTAIEASVTEATYRVPGRSINVKVRITNRSANPVNISEFETGGIRFLNAAVFKDTTGYPPQMLAEEGLILDDNTPIMPGESKVLSLTATDAAWENERLADVIYDPDSQFAALLFTIDAGGFRQVVPIGAPLIPRFM